MPEFKYIIDPKTKEKISLFDQKGGTILSDYVKKYKLFREKTKTKTNLNEVLNQNIQVDAKQDESDKQDESE